jgi:PIN domain nuclease of toxin-antitoxin system
VRLLIDSHVFVWLLFAPSPVGPDARSAIDSAERVVLSTVSLWELTLKSARGKLPHPPAELTRGVAALGVEELPIEHRHLETLPEIVLPHGDPFDALLIAQSRADDLVLMTADRTLLGSSYPTIDVRR